MTTRDLFLIIIRLIGIYLAYTGIVFVLTEFMASVEFIAHEPGFLLFLFMPLLGVLIAYVVLIRSADNLIDHLKLDKGFSTEKIDLSRPDFERIAAFIMLFLALILVAFSLPSFVEKCFLAFRFMVRTQGLDPEQELLFHGSDYSQWILNGVNLLIAYFIFTNSRRLGNWLVRINERNERGLDPGSDQSP